MLLLHNIAWIWTSSFLILWTVFSAYKSPAKIFRNLFLIGAPVLLLSIFLSQLSIAGSLFLFGKDFIIMGIIALLFSKFKANKIIAAGLFVAFLFGSFQWLKWDAAKKTQKTEDITVAERAEINDDFELLVLHDLFDLDQPKFDALVKKYNLQVETAFNPRDVDITELDEYWAIGIPDEEEDDMDDIIILLQKIEGIEWVEPNEVYRIEPIVSEKKNRAEHSLPVNDPMTAEQWALQHINMGDYYEFIQSQKISPVKTARLVIVDSGVEASHEDLKDHFTSIHKKHDKDINGHGTHCAGIAAAVTNNALGIASFDPTGEFVELSSVKAMNDLGMGNQRTVSRAIIEAIDAGADVISLSLGGRSNQKKEKAFQDVMDYADQHNVIMVVAAGNSSRSAALHTPANLAGVITVSAIDEQNQKTGFSNSVNEVTMGIAAPGQDILSTFPKNSYKTLSGTSMATPFVSGLVAMMRSLDPGLTAEKAFDLLNEAGLNTKDGALTGKCIQADAAIKAVYNQSGANQ